MIWGVAHHFAAAVDLPHAVLVDGEHRTAHAPLGAVGDEHRVFHGHQARHGVDLLALEPLRKASIGLFQALLVEIIGDLRRRASVVVHTTGAVLAHARIRNCHVLLLFENIDQRMRLPIRPYLV